eukprot:GHUV01032802.1.p1 GENE.GHUV01032802.1~~GHUV01032802.1.p1  ORF type:complete len:291 (-),score=124.57 GHUV01032802.1:761-1633(-)
MQGLAAMSRLIMLASAVLALAMLLSAGLFASGGPDAAAGDAAAAYGAAADGVTSPGALGAMQQQRSMRYSDGAAAGQDGYPCADGSAEVSRGIGMGGGSFKGVGYDPAAPVVHTYQAYEDRPAVAKAAYIGPAAAEGVDMDDEALIKADPSQVSAAAMFGSARMSSSAGVAAAAKSGALYTGGPAGSMQTDARPTAATAAVGGVSVGAPAPSGWPGDLPPPELLSAGASKDAEPVTDIAGEYVAAAFFSKNWQLRDAAAAWLADLVANGRVNDQRELAKALLKLLTAVRP